MAGRERATRRARFLTRDQVARLALHRAPAALFAMLRSGSAEDVGAGPVAVLRLDSQGCPGPWSADGVYCSMPQGLAEIWIIEMQSRSRRQPIERPSALVEEALTQVRSAPAEPDNAVPVVRLVEVRTDQRTRPKDQPCTSSDAWDCDPLPAVAFTATNRLLTHGPWTWALLTDPAAWPLWAFGHEVTPDRLARCMANVAALARQDPDLADIKALLRCTGRVRFPGDDRFQRIPGEEVRTMAQALQKLSDLEQLAPDEGISAEEAWAFLQAEIDAEHAAIRREGQREGQREGEQRGREALLAVVRSVAPSVLPELEHIEDLDELRDAISSVLARR